MKARMKLVTVNIKYSTYKQEETLTKSLGLTFWERQSLLCQNIYSHILDTLNESACLVESPTSFNGNTYAFKFGPTCEALTPFWWQIER